MDKKRLDQLLVEKGFASSRTFAQEMIKHGQVFLTQAGARTQVTKPGLTVPLDVEISVEKGDIDRFVSRAGLKLEAALVRSGLEVKDLVALDVGLSTGGFTDCLFQRGCRQVMGLEVGHGQTHPRVMADPRLKLFEQVNARKLHEYSHITAQFPAPGFDLIVMDVSFISMTLILPEVLPYLAPTGHFLGLVKPQFEVGPEGLAKGGLVKDPKYFVDVEKKIRESLESLKMRVMDYFPSEIEGKDGNQEFFVWSCPQ